jgi:hypothetical protein
MDKDTGTTTTLHRVDHGEVDDFAPSFGIRAKYTGAGIIYVMISTDLTH